MTKVYSKEKIFSLKNKNDSIVRAKFIGQNNSLSYIKNREYFLYISHTKSSIKRLDGSGYCRYESLSAFLKNWDNIIRVK